MRAEDSYASSGEHQSIPLCRHCSSSDPLALCDGQSCKIAHPFVSKKNKFNQNIKIGRTNISLLGIWSFVPSFLACLAIRFFPSLDKQTILLVFRSSPESRPMMAGQSLWTTSSDPSLERRLVWRAWEWTVKCLSVESWAPNKHAYP